MVSAVYNVLREKFSLTALQVRGLDMRRVALVR